MGRSELPLANSSRRALCTWTAPGLTTPTPPHRLTARSSPGRSEPDGRSSRTYKTVRQGRPELGPCPWALPRDETTPLGVAEAIPFHPPLCWLEHGPRGGCDLPRDTAIRSSPSWTASAIHRHVCGCVSHREVSLALTPPLLHIVDPLVGSQGGGFFPLSCPITMGYTGGLGLPRVVFGPVSLVSSEPEV